MGSDQANGNTRTDETYDREFPDGGGFVSIVPAGPLTDTEVDIVAIPAVGADPERTWIPQHPKERTKALPTVSSPPHSSKTLSHSLSPRRSARSLSNEPSRTPGDIDDGRDTSHGTWLTNDLREKIPQARILLYHHGNLREGDTLQTLADRLLDNICRGRVSMLNSEETHRLSRPIFFICHSTGGLVAKKAFNIAYEKDAFRPIAKDAFRPIAKDSHGMTFIATPHQGSAYLSSKEFWPSIRKVMRLRFVIPDSLQQQLRLGSVELRDMAENFKRYSTDLRITTYYETRESDLAFNPANDITPRSYHVPIASFASAIMDMEHESEIPLSSDHVGCATFKGDEEAQQTFMSELEVAVRSAASLSKVADYSMDLENKVKVEVNGFFEDETSSVKLWTARPSLAEFLKHGRKVLLEGRLLSRSKEDVKPFTAKEELQAVPSGSSMPSIKFPPEHPSEPRRNTITPTDLGPQLPTMDRLKLTWVHIPYTHPGWVPSVLGVFFKEKRPDTYLDFLKQEHWASNHNRGRHAAPHAKYVNSSFVNPTKGSRPQSDQSGTRFAIYLQYLHWDTYRQLLVRRLMIKRRMNQRGVRPIRHDVKNSESLEAKMIWKYLEAEPPFHCRRTLDQYGYPNLRSTEARDDDQMLWKRTKPKSHGPAQSSKKCRSSTKELYDYEFPADVERAQSARRSSMRQEVDSDESLQKKLEEVKGTSQEGNVIMVDQLWLWALDEKTIVTFFPKKEGFSSEGRLSQQGDLHNDIYNEVNSGLQSVPDAQTFAALIVQRAITILLERTAHRHLQILRIYEESLSILIERMTRSYKSFRKEGFSVRPEAYYRKKNGEPMTSQEKREKDLDIEKQSREDFSSLLELRDISDELHTIQKLFKEQRGILIDTARYYLNGEGTGEMKNPKTFIREAVEAVEPQKRDENGLNYLAETERSLNSFERSVSEMADSAESTEQAYSNLLDIKQKQASVDESRLARSQMDATAAQGRAIMIFTIFTIIFLPLSFFTSVFGMNVREWSDPQHPPPLHRIVYFIGPISVGVICIALTLAFSISIRSLFVVARKIASGVIEDLYHLLAKPLVKGSRLARGILHFIGVQTLLDRISDRYLRNKDQDYGKDHGIWNEYALPMHKSARDIAYEDDRVPSSIRRSFFNMIKGEKK